MLYIYIYIMLYIYIIWLLYCNPLVFEKSPGKSQGLFRSFHVFFSHTRFGGDFPQQPAMLEPTGGKPNQYL